MRKRIIHLLLLSGALLLAACAPVIVAGVGATALGVNERRTSGVLLEDQSIEIKVQTQISSDPERNQANVSVLSYNLNVLLTGEVPSQAFGLRIEESARRTENVRQVYNELIVSETANLGNRTNDTYLTGKVKTALTTGIRSPGFNSGHVKVKTARNTVYLMGIVTRAEANEAIEIARKVSGVEEVVPLFEIR